MHSVGYVASGADHDKQEAAHQLAVGEVGHKGPVLIAAPPQC